MSDFPIKIKPIKAKSEVKLPSSKPRQNPSNEVYYGDSSVAIPFRWESQPGTPKVNFHESPPLPPLTPPPSYQCSPARKSATKKHHQVAVNSNSSGILHSFLPKLILIKKSNVQSKSPSLSSSPSSSDSVRSSPFTTASKSSWARGPGQQRRRLSFSNSSRRKLEDEDDEDESHVSSLCFRNSRGCSASVIKLLLGRQYAA
ncbi:hypothetical protein ACH5RR_010282 [Cinchona calisaya]|uniref:Uncharacterized protein n=1 Tax=Cinchona calisaya TaxID=153742 RepID=A0ABD3AGJ1_9GENT